jgi:hypothetical protein
VCVSVETPQTHGILAFCHCDSDDDRRFVVSQIFAMQVDAIN